MANRPKRKSTTKRPAAKKPKASPTPARSRPSEDEIRRRAYELFEQRGGSHGQEDDDWLQAERELRGEE